MNRSTRSSIEISIEFLVWYFHVNSAKRLARWYLEDKTSSVRPSVESTTWYFVWKWASWKLFCKGDTAATTPYSLTINRHPRTLVAQVNIQRTCRSELPLSTDTALVKKSDPHAASGALVRYQSCNYRREDLTRSFWHSPVANQKHCLHAGKVQAESNIDERSL